jgi:hypothetical protein
VVNITPPVPDKNATSASPSSGVYTANRDTANGWEAMGKLGEAIEALNKKKKVVRSSVQDASTHVTTVIPASGIRTADVVASLIKQKKNKHIKPSSIETYEK